MSAHDGPRAELPDHPAGIHPLEIVRRSYVTPRMVRLVFGGAGAAGFVSLTPDEHVKIVFPDPETGETRVPVPSVDGAGLEWPRPFPPTREYTIRHVDAGAGEITIDFVVHPGGLASDWAQQIEVGSRVWIAGPRPGYRVPPAFTFQILLGDHTALPAIARWLEELAPGVRAVVGIQIPDAAERQDLAVRDGVEVTWFHEDDPDFTLGDLGDFLAALPRPADEPTYLWAAGEAGVLKPIRTWARAHGFARGTCDIAGYWRRPRTR